MAVNCYCRDCQRETSSAFATVLALLQTAFRLLKGEGERGSFTVKASSGREVTREFCKACGSPLFTQAEKEAWMPMAAGTQNYLENPEM